MLSVSEDEAIASLRRVCDRYAGRMPGHSLPDELVNEIFASLPHGVFSCVTLPASGADYHHLTVRIDPLFYRYVADAAEYCLSLAHGHISPKDRSNGLAANHIGVSPQRN
jgi:hypothetical protein